MARLTVVVVTVLMGLYLHSAFAESCTNFTTTTTVSADSATLKFSLPDTCIKEHQLRLVTVTVEKLEICAILPPFRLRASMGECSWEQTSQKYSLTRRLGATKTREHVSLTADFDDRERIVSSVLLELPDTTTLPSVTADKVTIADSSQTQPSKNRDTTDENAKPLEPSEDGAKPTDTGAGEHDIKEDIPSFTQTPAVIMGVVMAIMMILLVILLVRQKGIPALVRRRARNSLVIPDDYEHPTGSHNYERPIHRRGIQQQPLPPLPPPNPADVNRDSLLDPNYAVIDDVSGGYEVPKPVVPSVPTAGGSTQAESSL